MTVALKQVLIQKSLGKIPEYRWLNLKLKLPDFSDESGYPKIEPNRTQIGKYCKALEWLNTEDFSKNVSNFNAKLFAP